MYRTCSGALFHWEALLSLKESQFTNWIEMSSVPEDRKRQRKLDLTDAQWDSFLSYAADNF